MKKANGHTDGLWRAAVLTAVSSFGLSVSAWLALPLFCYGLEQTWAPPVLMTAVAAVTLWIVLLYAAVGYCRTALDERRDHYRTAGCIRLAQSVLTTSYERATDPAYRACVARLRAAWGHHIQAPLPKMWDLLAETVRCSVVAAAAMTVLVLQNVTAAVVTVLTALISAAVHRAVTRYNGRLGAEEAVADETLAFVGRAASSAVYAKDIRVFGLVPWLRSLNESVGQTMTALFKRRSCMCFVYNAADTALWFLRNAVGILLLLPSVLNGTVSLSIGLLCFTAIPLLSDALGKALEDASALSVTQKELRVWECFLEEEAAFADRGESPSFGDAPHELNLQRVSYAPSPEAAPLVSELSLRLRTGELVGVLCSGGVGASALAKLCCGLLTPTDGTLYFDGIDIATLSRQSYFEQVAAVFRESAVSDVTVEECVCSGRSVDGERLRACLAAVRMDETVDRLPLGVGTPIGKHAFDDGVVMSKGQLQRLLLARAMYKQAPLCILDDPLTALDPLAEQEILSSLRSLFSGSCVLLLSNRPSVLRHCDRLIVMRDGAVAEEGTHDGLMRCDGVYAAQFRLQRNGYREGRNPDGDE